MSLNANYQKLEPGDEVRLLEIDGRRLAWTRFCISTAITFPILQPKSSPLAAT